MKPFGKIIQWYEKHPPRHAVGFAAIADYIILVGFEKTTVIGWDADMAPLSVHEASESV